MKVEAATQQDARNAAAKAIAEDKERHRAINANSVLEGRAVGNIDGINGSYGAWNKQKGEMATRDELIQMLKEALRDPVNCAVIIMGTSSAYLADILAILEEQTRREKLQNQSQKSGPTYKAYTGPMVPQAKEAKAVEVAPEIPPSIPPPSVKGRKPGENSGQDIL